jgi:hypothetical protein
MGENQLLSNTPKLNHYLHVVLFLRSYMLFSLSLYPRQNVDSLSMVYFKYEQILLRTDFIAHVCLIGGILCSCTLLNASAI